MAKIEGLTGLTDVILPSLLPFENGKTYAEDDVYSLRYLYVTENGIVREYGIRRSDGKKFVINIKEVAPLLKKMESTTLDVV